MTSFSSKEDIVKFYFSNIMQAYLNDFMGSDNRSFENYMFTLFKHFYKFKKELLLIYQNGLAYLILDTLNSQFEQKSSEKYMSTEEKYHLYFHTGGIYNFYILWFSHDMKETPEELTKIAVSFFPDDAAPNLI